MTDVIFSTIHGSRLYGLHHQDSDYDTFAVTTSTGRKGRTNYNEDTLQDTVRMPLKAFLRHVQSGSHQSVEALFSPYQDWNPDYVGLKPMLDQYRITGPEVSSRYRRTIRSFCFGDFKRRRHAARLSLNLADLERYRRFNPVLTEEDIEYVNAVAELDGEELWEALRSERS